MLKRNFIFLIILLCTAFPTIASESLAAGVLSTPHEKKQNPQPNILPFGSELFTGEFAKQSFSGFNPSYVINIGDQIAFQMWGGFELDTTLTVDAQGNVFIPKVGPVKVVGVANGALNEHLLNHIKTVYKSNVSTYASLKTAQPVKVYVTGQVNRPGLYAGLSSDSLLYYIDKSGGINPNTGSYIDIRVKRGKKNLHRVNLYQFLLSGNIAPIQLMDGDIILVGDRKNIVTVRGELERSSTVEFYKTIKAKDLLRLVRPTARASHMRVIRQGSKSIGSEYIKLDELGDYMLENGDQVELVADKRFKTISIRIQGEHSGQKEIIMPYGASLEEAMDGIQYSALSNKEGVQLFRSSVKERQKDMIMSSLNSLEETVLTARSQTLEAAKLRQTESEQILKWIEKARTLEPRGQVVLGNKNQYSNIALEDGDIINIPKDSGLVMIHGEVMFPSALSYDSNATVDDYVKMTGGYSRRQNVSKILIMHPNGRFSELELKRAKRTKLSPNDEILVLPKVDVKSTQITKDITEVIYQIALSTRVFLGL